MEITPEQIRAARALLRLEQSDLARRAGVSVVTIRRVEAADCGERVSPATFHSVYAALEEAGAEFIPLGVRKRRPVGTDTQALYDDLRAISLHSAAHLQSHDVLTDADLYDENGLPA
jgi:predicted transcriptional regulator